MRRAQQIENEDWIRLNGGNRNLAGVIYHLSSVEEGQQLLAYAAHAHCQVEYALPLEISPKSGGERLVQVQPDGSSRTTILLNPEAPLAQQIRAAGRELARLSQGTEVKRVFDLMLPGAALTPMVQLGLQRIANGANKAFETKLNAQITKATGLKIENGFRTDRTWSTLFVDFQASAAARKGDADTIAHYEMVRDNLGAEAFNAKFNIRSFDAAGDMRVLLREGLNPNAPRYLEMPGTRDLAMYVLSKVDPKIKEKARQLGM